MRIEFNRPHDQSTPEPYVLFSVCNTAMKALAQLLRHNGRSSSPRRRERLGCESLEARQMLTGTPVGDANYDNQFDEDDLQLLLQDARYGTSEPASWRQGDWNGDGLFDSADIVLALQEGNYGQGQIVPNPTPPKNVILFIGDGMGYEHVKAASLFLGEELSFEGFPFQTAVDTSNADADVAVTDSAATATAIATGVKANNRVISQHIPGDGSDLTTILELFNQQGRSTGLVTTTSVTDATPAAFGAHEPDRDNAAQIAADYFRDSRPNVLMGADAAELATSAVEAGYTVVTDVHAMNEVAAAEHSVESLVFGGFVNYNNLDFHDQMIDFKSMALEADEVVAQLNGTPSPFADLGNPHLSEMTEAALDVLGQNDEGFFLMVESANIDKMSHFAGGNDFGLSAFTSDPVRDSLSGISIINMETVELGNAVQAAVDWIESRDLLGETLILVTADHETAGLVITTDNGPGQHPDVEYTSDSFDFGFPFYSHTAANVPIYAIGQNAVLFGDHPEYGTQVLDNTEILDRVRMSQSHFVSEDVAQRNDSAGTNNE